MGMKIALGLSGIVLIGIGDAAASWIGISFGRHRWPGTKKSFVGSWAFFMSCFLVYSPLMYIYPECILPVSCMLIVITLTEAWTTENDNVVLPLLSSLIMYYFVP
jgi:dolichol kinase